MKHLAGLCALLLVSAGPASGQAVQPSPDAVAQADKLFGTMAADRPGAVVLVTRKGQTVYSRAFGAADLEQGVAIKADTRFHVASVSKQFTALAIALLAKDGKIRLDEDIHTYLPELPDFGARITVADLLHHTSGLRDQWELLVLSGHNAQDLLTQGGILALVQKQGELNFAPQTEYRYSNTGFTLAAEIVARVSGMPFRRFVQERIFTPLGMTNSLIYDNAAEIVPGRANSYAVSPTGTVLHRRLNYSNFGATSMITTAADLDKWAQELRAPKLFDPAFIQSLHAPLRLKDGTLSNYGLGLYKDPVRGRLAIMHGGADAGFRTLFATYPAEDASIIILTNGSADMTPLHEGLVDIFLNDGAAPPPTVQPKPAELARLVGYYSSGWGPGLELKLQDGKLVRSGASTAPASFRKDGLIEFTGPVTRFRIAKSAGGQVTALDELPTAGTPVRYERLKRKPVAAAELPAFAGRYRSEELDTTYRLVVAGEGLALTSLQFTDPIQLTSVGADRFDFPMGRILFSRGADGKPNGFKLTSGRARNLRFERVD